MGKGAIVSILAFLNVRRIVRAEFFFISLVLIQLFNSRVRIRALISFGTFLSLYYILAHILREFPISFSIFGIVVVHTMLVGVDFRVTTGLKLKKIKIEILDHTGLDELVASLAGMSNISDHLTLLSQFEILCFGRSNVFHSIFGYSVI